MISTYGIYFFHGRDLLICHANRSNPSNWSVPKGLPNYGEDPLETALREFKEETGVDVKSFSSSIEFVGEIEYKTKKKKFIGFIAFCEGERPEKLSCSSMTPSGFPEIDIIEWTPITVAIKMIHEAQRKLLTQFMENDTKSQKAIYLKQIFFRKDN